MSKFARAEHQTDIGRYEIERRQHDRAEKGAKMIKVGEVQTTPPQSFKTELQRDAYEALEAAEIPYERVDTDEIITMEDCAVVNEKLNMEMVKTLFLCNRQKTEFYLFITRGDKPFRSKELSLALDIPRVSFAPAELMEKMLGTTVGAATVFGMLRKEARDIRLIIDREVIAQEYYGCSDGTTTGYMKIKTDDLIRRFLPHAGIRYTAVRV